MCVCVGMYFSIYYVIIMTHTHTHTHTHAHTHTQTNMFALPLSRLTILQVALASSPNLGKSATVRVALKQR